MTERPDMHDWEAQINALLDGELDDPGADRLRLAAERDRELARAIIEAYRLQQAMRQIPRERAPASLRRKLRRIPREQRAMERPAWFQPRWAAALATVPLLAVLALSQMGPRQPTEAEIMQARQDLALAFGYLEKATRVTNSQVQSAIGHGFSEPVTETTVRTIHDHFDLSKERDA